jgi:EmrB/QacA subfamily drug resistance transporter
MGVGRRQESGGEGVRQLGGLKARWEALPSPRFTRKPNYIWWVVGTVCVGAFMAAVDASIVNVAIPTLQSSFHATAGDTSWVLIAYLLTLASAVTAIGRFADMVGRRPLYTFGFLVFIVGSALCGAALSLPMLIASRVLQALGAAMLQANSVAIITATVPASVRGKAIGFQGSAQAVGLSIGPAVGGALIALFGWRAIFYVNVPVGIIGTVLGSLILPKDRPGDSRVPFDWTGMALFAGFLVGIMLGLTEGPDWGWASASVLSMFVAGLILLWLFIRREAGFPFPMVRLELFRIKVMTIGNITGLLSYAAMFGTLVLMPYFLKEVIGFPEATIGLLLTPVPVAMTVLAPIAGGLADRYGSRMLTTSGMGLTALGCLLLGTTLGVGVSVPMLVIELLLVGAGLGLFTPPNNSSVMGSSPKEHLGVAGGILNMSRSLGMSLGTAFSLAVMTALLLSLGASTKAAAPAQWTVAVHGAFLGLAALSIVATALSALRAAGDRGAGHSEAHPIELA